MISDADGSGPQHSQRRRIVDVIGVHLGELLDDRVVKVHRRGPRLNRNEPRIVWRDVHLHRRLEHGGAFTLGRISPPALHSSTRQQIESEVGVASSGGVEGCASNGSDTSRAARYAVVESLADPHRAGVKHMVTIERFRFLYQSVYSFWASQFEGEFRSAQQPIRPVKWVRAERCRPFESGLGSSRTTATDDPPRSCLKFSSQVVVGADRRGSTVPDGPVWVVCKDLCERRMRGNARKQAMSSVV